MHDCSKLHAGKTRSDTWDATAVASSVITISCAFIVMTRKNGTQLVLKIMSTRIYLLHTKQKITQ